MTRNAMLASSTLLVAASLSFGAQAETFRWASTTDPQTMDPHAANLAPVTSFLNNIYEGLVRRNADMQIEPSLALSWEPLDGEDGWRFHLREGVVFHGGEDFTADDVLFSYERAIAEQSDVRSWFAPVAEVRVVDEYTIDFVTAAPNPLFPDSIANFMILDRGWAESNGAEVPARDEEKYTTRNTNGTGPFILTERAPGVEIRLEPNPRWWDEATHNLSEAVFNPIDNDATGLAALLSGEIDMLAPVPIRDVARLRETDGIRTFEGLETRVIMLGFNHAAGTLWQGGTGIDANPFANPQVRRAAAHAIDVAAINKVLMSGMAEPASQLLPEGLSGWSESRSERPVHDPDIARDLMAAAGHSDGFTFGLRCTNDRYLNDENVCQAVTGMLQQVGLNAQLETMPVRNYWGELRDGNFDMFLLGWSPGTFDAEHPIRFLAATPDGSLGSWNFGAFSDERVDDLLPQIQQELDPLARQEMLDEVAAILQDRVAYIPLYSEPLVWAARDGIELIQRPDNFFMLRWVNVAK